METSQPRESVNRRPIPPSLAPGPTALSSEEHDSTFFPNPRPVNKTMSPQLSSLPERMSNPPQRPPPLPSSSPSAPNSVADSVGHLNTGARSSKLLWKKLVWLPEVVSFLVAVLAMIGAVLLLAIHRGKPMPNWPAFVSINSLLAIFTSVMKAALVYTISEGISELKWVWFSTARSINDLDTFDGASRGPWGSLMLLIRHPRNLLASLAAIIVIASLAIDPFTQQVLQFSACLSADPTGSASIARTNFYSASGTAVGDSISVASQDFAPDAATAAALYAGLINPPLNATVNIPFNCPSGNCTNVGNDQGTYYSLAMCYNVTDITHLLSKNDITQQTKRHDSVLWPRSNTSYFNYSLPSGTTIGEFSSPQSLGSDAIVVATGGFSSLLSGTAALPSADSIPAVFQFESIIMRPDRAGTLQPWAFAAYLYPCIQEYSNGSVFNFVLSEQSGDTVSLQQSAFYDNGTYFSLAGNYPSLPGQDCSPSESSQGNKTAKTMVFQNTSHIYVDPSLVIQPNNSNLYLDLDIEPDSTLYYDPGCVYVYGSKSASGLTYSIGDFFSQDRILNANEGKANETFGSPWLQALYRNGTADLDTVDTYVQGLANALTAVLRQNGDANHALPATGTAYVNQTCIDVEWGWLALPISILVLTLVFNVLVAIISRHTTSPSGHAPQAGRRPWKSSSLPLLWCGLTDEIRDSHGAMDSPEEMKESGRTLEVSLERASVGNGQMHGEKYPRGRWKLTDRRSQAFASGRDDM